ncbi:hypothetical protein C8R43DRAFT_902490, partial [Mycena crocata]
VKLHIGWVPGHIKFAPNERVDKAAKEAAQRYPHIHPRIPLLFHSTLPCSAAAAKAAFQTQTMSLWTNTWKSSSCHKKFSRLDKNSTVHTVHKPLITLSCWNLSLIIQLYTQMVGLNAWLYRIHCAESPTCHCWEDIPHFIFFCAQSVHHHILLHKMLGHKSSSLGYLLTNKKGIRHLLHYIHTTNCLPAYQDTTPQPEYLICYIAFNLHLYNPFYLLIHF